jgi:hypothetical protein
LLQALVRAHQTHERIASGVLQGLYGEIHVEVRPIEMVRTRKFNME